MTEQQKHYQILNQESLTQNQQGVALILVSLILLVSSILAITLITYYQATTRTSQVEAYRMQALYLAEAGVNQVIQQLRNNQSPSFPYTGSFAFFQGQTGAYSGSFSVNRTIAGNNTTLLAEATVPTSGFTLARRTLRVIFNHQNYQILRWEELLKGR